MSIEIVTFILSLVSLTYKSDFWKKKEPEDKKRRGVYESREVSIYVWRQLRWHSTLFSPQFSFFSVFWYVLLLAGIALVLHEGVKTKERIDGLCVV